MGTNPRNVKIAPKGMGLNDFVAWQEGYFAAEGLEVEFDWKTFRGTQSSWKGLSYFERPQDKIYAEGQEVIQGACGGASATPAPAWAVLSRTLTVFRRGRFSFDLIPPFKGRRI